MATMKALETQLAGMLGRFHIEIKAIIGFARLTSGDCFEVLLKHGNQRWKTRGKTQPDRTQTWEQTNTVINCIYDAPIYIKVMESRFFKSKCLNERNFDATRFFAAQPQLVTMNLNTSLKLQLVVTWLPLLSTKCRPKANNVMPANTLAQQQAALNGMSRSMACILTAPSTLHDINHVKQISSASQVSMAFGSRSKSTDTPPERHNDNDDEYVEKNDATVSDNDADADESSPSLRRSNYASSTASTDARRSSGTPADHGVEDSPPRICLREKKRQRRSGTAGEGRSPSSAASSVYSSVVSIGMPLDKDRWRHSSTMILDTLYKDLSKSIPSIDDLAAAKTHKSGRSERKSSSFDRNRSTSEAREDTPRDNVALKTSPTKTAASLITTTEDIGATASTSSLAGGSVNGSTKKSRLSSLKKSRQNSNNKLNASYYAKVPTLDAIVAKTTPTPSARPFSTICVEEPPQHAVDALIQMRRRPPTAPKSSLDAISEAGRDIASTEQTLKTVNALLAQIEALRRLVSRINLAASMTESAQSGEEFAELVGFEACMLNWEAILKLNRASIIDNLRSHRLGGLPSQPSGYLRRMSLYIAPQNQLSHLQISHSPSTASDDADDALQPSHLSTNVTASLMDQISENDSGIDSLRQHVSPYNSQQQQQRLQDVSNSVSVPKTRPEGSAPSPNRFKQFKERRKSLGAMLDAIHPSRRNSADQNISGGNSPPSALHFDAIRAETLARTGVSTMHSHRALTSSVSSASSESESRRGSSTSHSALRLSATGHVEVDECLAHHFALAIKALEKIAVLQATPFEYTLAELLTRIEHNTMALEALRRVVYQFPAPPNLGMLFHELGVREELRDIWISAVALSHTALLVSSEAICHRLRLFVQPIVTARRYPTLINNVVDSIMKFICERDDSNRSETHKVTLFQFVAFFSGKDLSVFIENVSHEAWITVNLDSCLPIKVREVMDRLRKVPVVPPLESLRHVALVLAAAAESVDGNTLSAPIERYLNNASVKLACDLAASFMCILEHDDEASRLGACHALFILLQENTLTHLQYLSAHDTSKRVRAAAREAAVHIIHEFSQSPAAYDSRYKPKSVVCNGRAYAEVTKI